MSIKNRFKQPSTAAVLSLIVAAGVVIRFVGIGSDSFWFDELQTVWVTKIPLSDFMTGLTEWGDVPFYYVVGRVWFAFSTNEAWIRSLSLLAGTGTVVTVYFLGKELFSRDAGLWGAALTAASPFLIWYSQDATLYSWLAASSLLSLYLLTRCVTRGGWRNWVLYIVVTAATFFTHLFTVTLFLAEMVYYFVVRDRRRNRLAPWLISQVVLLPTMLFTWWISWEAGHVTDFVLKADRIGGELLNAPVVLIGGADGFDMLKDVASSIFLNIAAGYLLFMALVFMILTLVIKRWRQSAKKQRIVALILYTFVTTLIPIVIFTTASEFVDPERFYLWAAPTLLLLIAVYIVSFTGRTRQVAGAIAVAALVFITVASPQPPTHVDYRATMDVVTDNYKPGDYLLCFPFSECAVAEGSYLPEELPMGGGLVEEGDYRGLRVALLPTKDEWYDYFLHQKMGEAMAIRVPVWELPGKLDAALAGSKRVWVIMAYGDECNGCDMGRDMMMGGWRIVDTWKRGDATIYLYSRTGA